MKNQSTRTVRIPVIDGICLTEVRPTDKAAFVEHLREKEISDNTLQIPYPYTESDADAFLKIVEEELQRHGRHVHFAIRDRDDFLIGGLGFKELQLGKPSPQSHRAEIGYWLAKPYWGRGIATAAVRAACDHAFADFGLVKITAHVFAGNVPSARVLEKCGFEREAYLKRHYRKKDTYLDVWMYGLLKRIDEMPPA